MKRESDEVNNFIESLSGYARDKFKTLSVGELETHITQSRHYIGYLHQSNPDDKRLAGLQDALFFVGTG